MELSNKIIIIIKEQNLSASQTPMKEHLETRNTSKVGRACLVSGHSCKLLSRQQFLLICSSLLK